MASIKAGIRFLLSVLQGLIRLVFGRFDWQPPRWLSWLFQSGRCLCAWMMRRPKTTAASVLIIVMAGVGAYFGWQWYEENQRAHPKPVLVTMEVTNPPLTNYEENDLSPRAVYIKFSRPVAQLGEADKLVPAGITLTPPMEGFWSWSEDNTLIFYPAKDWPVGVEYTVTFDPAQVFRPEAKLKTLKTSFQTAPFVIKEANAEFYQDPNDAANKQAVATISFSHPVDTADFEKHVTLRMAGQKTGVMGVGAESTGFTVTYDKKKLNAYIHSVPLAIPALDTSLSVNISEGVRSSLGGTAIKGEIAHNVAIPGINSLQITDVAPSIVTNEKFEPEQVLVLNTSVLTHERQINQSVRAWVLPEKWPKNEKERTEWTDINVVGLQELAASEKLTLTPIPAEQEVTNAFSYRFNAPPGRYVYVQVSKGLTSFGGYKLAKDSAQIFEVPAYPAEVRIMAQGSLLALSGERKLPVIARDVKGIRYEIARVLPQHLSQLVDFGIKSNDNYSEPTFNGRIDETYLSEMYSQEIKLPTVAPGKAQYRTLDFAQYLKDGRRGIFLLRVQAWKPPKEKGASSDDESTDEDENQSEDEGETEGKVSQRLIVVTDLGVIDKRTADDSHDLFIQSIHTGKPVAGVLLEVIGRNGLPVLQATTDSSGHARFPSLKDFVRERAPVMFVARKDNDTSFLPYSRSSSRQLNFSRFDVGGIANSVDTGTLSAYLFSDRGIYRPGEEMRLGMIVRTADWSRSAKGLPLEAEILDARGMVVKRDRISVSTAGFDELKYTTQDTAPTGTYTVNLRLVKDGRADTLLGSTTVKVQDFEPDRLRMTAKFNHEAAEGWVAPDDLAINLSLQNLFGTPAENRRMTARMTLSPGALAFPRYKNYVFTDPQRAQDAVSEQLNETESDDKGEATLPLDLNRFASATYRVHVVAQGFEADGGRGVAAEASVLVSSLPYLIGYKPDGDFNYVRRGSARSVELIAIDPTLKPYAADKLKLQRVEKRYVSVLTKQDDGTYRYESREKQILLDEKPFVISKDGYKLPLETSTPGTYNFVVRDANGLEYARIAYNVAGEGNVTHKLDKDAELKLTLAKNSFAAGEDVEVQIQSPYIGSGLITIERDKVYSHIWFNTKTTSSVQKIKLPAGIEGNAYLTVTFIRDPASDEIYTSPLSYGVVPFSINLDQRKLKLDVQSPDLVKPGDTVKMHLTSNKAARVVLFAVDEGVLQVARYKRADPLAYFFQKRSLDVSTSQILDLILPEFSRIMAAAPGGDGDAALGRFLNPFKRKRDQAVAYWSGVVDVGPQGRDFNWQVPESFNGSLRVMAVAVSDDAIGIGEKKTLVRGDFVLSPNAPMTVAPGDEFDISVGVANNLSDSGTNAKVSVSLDTGKQFQIIGNPRIDAPIAANHEGVVHFRLRAGQQPGAGALKLTAAIGSKQARLSTEVSVRPVTPYMQKFTAGTISAGQQIELPITRSMFDEHRVLRASASPLPLSFSPGLTAYLDVYPYSCTEQLVSQGIPALILSKRSTLGSISSQKGDGLPKIIQMLRSRQNAEGAYGLWAGNQTVDLTSSLWAQQFLIEAKDRGQTVPADLLAHGNEWLKSFATNDIETSSSLETERQRAQAIYLLTRQGQQTGSLASALQKRLETHYAKLWKRDLTAMYLASTYQMLKQDKLADSALSEFRLGEMSDAQGRYVNYSAVTDPLSSSFYAADRGNYDGLVRDSTAITLLVRHFPARYKTLPEKAFEPMLTALQRGWYASLSSAKVLLALDAMADMADANSSARFSISEILADGKARELALPAGLVPQTDFSASAKKLSIRNVSNQPGFYAMDESGFDLTPSATEVRNGLEVLREYTDDQGKPLSTIKQGDEVFVHLKFRSLSGIEPNIALVDLLPGGFELVPNTPVPQDDTATAEAQEDGNADAAAEAAKWQLPFGQIRGNWALDYADAREDRIVLYVQASPGLQEFVYRIKATNAGSFNVPPTYAESMYRRTVKSVGKAGGKLTVQANK